MNNTELKTKIIEALRARRATFSASDARFAISIGVNPAQYSRIKNGDVERVLSQQQWLALARTLNVSLDASPPWNTAATPVYNYVTTQLRWCQEQSASALLCAPSDVGKTYAARSYASVNANVCLVDCSQFKSKSELVRQIAKSYGIEGARLSDLFKDLCLHLKTIDHPLIILDEAGDLYYEAMMAVKSLWNATEYCCGFYMMGADGLRALIERMIRNRKVGYAELFSRFGKRTGKELFESVDNPVRLLEHSASQIIKANAPDEADVNAILRAVRGDDGTPSLRRIARELKKQAAP